jgi:SAM-dependent methyltransferase
VRDKGPSLPVLPPAPAEEAGAVAPSPREHDGASAPPRARLTSATYAVRAPLLEWLAQEARLAASAYGRLRVLDVGCGAKPYYPLFAPFADTYVGVDAVNPAADATGTVEDIPVADGSYHVVICTQVLEHALDPARAVSELWRVTTPGGRVLLSTHGVQVYHPSPVDLWRWTHEGLERLFRENAEWSSVAVRPGSGTAACMAMLTGIYVDILAQKAHARFLGKPVVAGLNTVGALFDRHSAELREPRPGGLYANFHVVAEKPAGDSQPAAAATR